MSGCRAIACLRLPDILAPDQAVPDRVNMLDHHVSQDIPIRIANNRMHPDHRASGLVGVEADRLDARINGPPLARPVVTNAVMTIHAPAFPAVGPVNIRVHGSEYG